MKTPTWKNQNLGTINGFKIELQFHEEDSSMREHFSECGWTDEQYKGIRDNYWFVAEIAAYKGVIKCGSSFLGGNCYKNLKEVMQDGTIDNILSGYADQMIEEAVEEAKENLAD